MQGYYEILELKRDCNIDQINANFKRLALRHHPLRNPTDMATNAKHFNAICEAFDVLSNPIHKSVYDMYGFETQSSNSDLTFEEREALEDYQYRWKGNA